MFGHAGSHARGLIRTSARQAKAGWLETERRARRRGTEGAKALVWGSLLITVPTHFYAVGTKSLGASETGSTALSSSATKLFRQSCVHGRGHADPSPDVSGWMGMTRPVQYSTKHVLENRRSRRSRACFWYRQTERSTVKIVTLPWPSATCHA